MAAHARRKDLIRVTLPIFLYLLLGSLSTGIPPLTSSAEALEPTRHALLIGVNQYSSPGIPDLRGTVHPALEAVTYGCIFPRRTGHRGSDIPGLF